MYSTASTGPLGVTPVNQTARFIARGAAVAVGAVRAIDIAATDADTVNIIGGDTGSAFVNAVVPGTQDVLYGQLVVATTAAGEDVPRGFTGQLSGHVRALVIKASGNVAVGDPLVAVDGEEHLSADGTTGQRIVARALEALTAPTAATMALVAFDGVHGLGVVA